jgi:hypothetical protein
MRRTVRRVSTDAQVSCIGTGPGARSCGWTCTYVGQRASRTAAEAARRHLEREGHSSVIVASLENVYSTWPSASDIRAWGLAEFEDS